MGGQGPRSWRREFRWRPPPPTLGGGGGGGGGDRLVTAGDVCEGVRCWCVDVRVGGWELGYGNEGWMGIHVL